MHRSGWIVSSILLVGLSGVLTGCGDSRVEASPEEIAEYDQRRRDAIDANPNMSDEDKEALKARIHGGTAPNEGRGG